MKAQSVAWLCALLSIVQAAVTLGQHDIGAAPNAHDWAAAFDKADKLVASLNMSQKAMLVTGNLGTSSGCIGIINPVVGSDFGGLCMMDGPFGVHPAASVSLFPAGLAQAATWDTKLVRDAGQALGKEFGGKGAHVMLGPTVGPMGRHPLGGRNWEALSVDPYLAGELVGEQIQGIQSTGVQACVKHLVGNEQETQRSKSYSPSGASVEAISSNIDDRTMHEFYLWPFANAIKNGVASIMCSYNRLNQTYACENEHLLNGLVKKELGFKGYIMSDWFATHSGAPAVKAGLDMNMPGPFDETAIRSPEPWSLWGGNLTAAVSNGTLSEDYLDDMIRRILARYYAFGQNKGYPTVDPTNRAVFASTINLFDQAKAIFGFDPSTLPPPRDVRGDHAKLIRKIGAEGVVLLKNVGNVLPLKKPRNLGVFGNDAADVSEGFNYRLDNAFTFDIGTLAHGGGSASGRPNYIVSPLEALRKRVEQRNGNLQYVLSNEALARGDLYTIYPTPDVCLVFLKTFSREGHDRTSFENDWNSTLVVQTVADHCNNTVVVTHSSGVNTYPWASHPNVKAILAAHYPGQETGNSIADVLFGDVNPSGKLPYTIPVQESDYGFPILNLTGDAAYDAAQWQDDFTEGLLVDYRHFDAKNITPLYEFGFGLSYTSFSLPVPLSVVKQASTLTTVPQNATGSHPGGNPQLWDSVVMLRTTLKNTGKLAGAQVVQLYASFAEAPEGTPVRVLRGFQKIYLGAGESRQVTFSVRRRDVSVWNVEAQDWEVPRGSVKFEAGFSSRMLLRAVEVKFR